MVIVISLYFLLLQGMQADFFCKKISRKYVDLKLFEKIGNFFLKYPFFSPPVPYPVDRKQNMLFAPEIRSKIK
jgi:hypothetical protein